MKQKRLLGGLALLVSSVLLFTACINPFDIVVPLVSRFMGGSGSGMRRVIPFSDMKYSRPDVPTMKTDLQEMIDNMYSAESYMQMVQYANDANGIFEEFVTMSTLADLHWCLDVNDAYYEEETRYCNEAGVELATLGTELNRALVEGPFAQEYRDQVGEYYYQSMVNSLMLSSPEVEQYKKDREALNTDYHSLLSNMGPVEYDGEEYAMEDIMAVQDGAQRQALYMAIYAENADEFTQIFNKMVQLDKKTADTLGFSSPAEMYYLTYSRDYTPEDAMELCENSKRIFAPMVESMQQVEIPSIGAGMNQTFSKMPSALNQIDPELAQVWESMVQYGLCDYEARSGKQSERTAFTTYIYAYDAPYCYGYWDGDFRSVTTVIHEFGHFYDSWIHYDTASAQNLDIVEIYSQGLELLMHETFVDFTDQAEAARLSNLMDFFDVMLYQAMLEEFTQELYAMEDFDAEEIAVLYADLLGEYGYGDYAMADEAGADYTWYRVTHLFDAPFYTISYCTSASVALQIWAQAQEDWQAGVDTYMALIHADQNQPFLQLVEGAGLRGPQDAEVLEEIAMHFEDAFSLAAAA